MFYIKLNQAILNKYDIKTFNIEYMWNKYYILQKIQRRWKKWQIILQCLEQETVQECGWE